MTRQTKVVTAALSVDELLAQSPWFVALDDAAKTRVRADITERAVAAGQSLGRHGERQQMWFGVLEGIIKWSITARDGQTVTLGGQSMGSWRSRIENGGVQRGWENRRCAVRKYSRL